MFLQLPTRTLTIGECRRYLRLYNTGRYKGRPNLNVDQDAYELFRAGLLRDASGLRRQILFIGRDFGGAQQRFIPIPLADVADVISRRIEDPGSEYTELVLRAPAMHVEAATPELVQRLITPFSDLPTRGKQRNFPVWASKVLHFSRLDAFPVLDSKASLALSFTSGGSYVNYLRVFRSVYVAGLPILDALAADDPSSPTMLRRLDKLLYQVGREIETAKKT